MRLSQLAVSIGLFSISPPALALNCGTSALLKGEHVEGTGLGLKLFLSHQRQKVRPRDVSPEDEVVPSITRLIKLGIEDMKNPKTIPPVNVYITKAFVQKNSTQSSNRSSYVRSNALLPFIRGFPH